MSYSQVVIAIIGWLLIVILNNRTLRRSEISRLKDRLVDKIQSIEAAIDAELDSEPNPLCIENLISTRATHIELRVAQLNEYARHTLVGEEHIVQLRDFDIFSISDKSKVKIGLRSITSDLIESVESNYDSFFLKQNPFARLWHSRKPEIFGMASALLILSLFFHVLSFIIP